MANTNGIPASKEIHSGVRNLGYAYEELVPAYFALELVKDPDVKNFKFKLNPSSYTKFDDLIVEIEHKNGFENLAIQLKHRENGRDLLEVDEFYRKGKNFDIAEYCNAFNKLRQDIQDNYKFVLYTNTNFQRLEESKSYKIKKNVKPFKTEFFNRSKILKFEETRSYNNQFGSDFWDKFYLFYNQKNFEKLRETITEIFIKNFKSTENAAVCYMSFFGDVRKVLYKNNEIDRDTIILKLVDLLLPNFTLQTSPKKNCKKLELLEDSLRLFDISFIQDPDNVIKNYHICDTPTDKENIEQLALKYKIIVANGTISEEKIQKLCSYFNEKPLFVKFVEESEEIVYQLVELCQTLINFKIRFVLVGNKPDKTRFTKTNIFEKLSDLKDSKLYNDIVSNFGITVQGRKSTSLATLKSEFGLDLGMILTLKELFESLEFDLKIGRDVEPLPKPFISRYLIRDQVSYQDLKKICEENITTVHCSGSSKRFKSFLKSHNFEIPFIDARDFRNGLRKPLLVLTDQDSCTNCDNYFHHLKLVKDNSFEWLVKKVNPDIPEIFDNQLNVICGNPGIGKTTMMKYLANKCPLNYWIVNVPLKQLSSFLKNIKTCESFLSEFITLEKHFDQQFLNYLKSEKKIMLFFDGLDELSNDCISGTLRIIKILLNEGYKCWISCTKRLKQILDQEFKTNFCFIYDIEELEKADQIKYVQQKLKNEKKTEDYVNKVIQQIFKYDKNTTEEASNILKLPLCLFLVTEIVSNLEEINKVEDFLTLSNMYSSFVNAKLEHKLKEANSVTNILTFFKTLYLEECKIGALKSCLEPSHFESLKIKSHEIFLKQIRENGDFLGFIININPDETFAFIHNTIAQYFAASWFSENFTKILPQQRKFLFRLEYTGIRVFLNLKLAENCPLHLAILNQDVAKVKEMSKLIDQLDTGGRTPIHLASSLETKLPNSEEIPEKNVEILKILLEGDSSKILSRDNFFQWNCFEYADAALSLSSLEELSKKEQLQRDYLTNYNDLLKLAEKCVKFGYINLLTTVIGWKSLAELDKCEKPFLHLALENDQTEIAKFLIDNGADLEKTDNDKRTILHKASLWNYTEIVELLLKRNVNLDAEDFQKQTPLHYAAKMGYFEIVKQLVKNGANLDALDTRRRTPLHKASYTGKTQVVRYLLKNGAAVTFRDYDEKTPLQRATIMGQFETVKCLIDFQANICAVDKNKKTVLHYAAYWGYKNIVEYLIKEGSDVFGVDDDGKTARQIAEKRGFKEIAKVIQKAEQDPKNQKIRKIEQSELHQAASLGDLVKIKKMLQEGASIEETDDDNQTVLHLAAIEGHYNFVKFLLEQGANKFAKNRDGRIPLHLASQRGHSEVVKLLLEGEKTGVNSPDKWNLTPLHRAAYKGHLEVVKILTNAGASLEARQSRGGTPLYSAGLGGHTPIVGFLHSQGAKIEAINSYNETCLHAAALKGCSQVASYIIDNWKNVIDFVDNHGRTALHWAAEKGCMEMVVYLVEAGASIYIRDSFKKMPVDVARDAGKEEIVEYLREQRRG